MNLVTPWTKAAADKLKPFDGLVTLALIGVIAVTAYVLLVGKPQHKALWLAFVMMP